MIMIHFLLPESKRAFAAQAFSGQITEFPIRFTATPDGPSALWNISQGQSATWYGNSQQFAQSIAESLFDAMAGSESWFAAIHMPSGTIIAHNCDTPPPGPLFTDLIPHVGLEGVEA